MKMLLGLLSFPFFTFKVHKYFKVCFKVIHFKSVFYYCLDTDFKYLNIFASSISTPYPNQGLYPHPAMTGVQLVIVVWGSLWLEKKKRRLLWCEEQ